MDEYKRRRRRSRAVMSMFLDSLGGSIDNVDVATFDSDGTDLKALIVGIEPVQSGTGDPSPDNIRPISGRSSVNVIVSPTLNPLDGTITNIPLGGTYYGGQLDVLTGVLTVTHGYSSLSLNAYSWNADPNRTGVFYGGLSGRKPGSDIAMCNTYVVNNVSVTTDFDNYISGASSYGGGVLFIRDTAYAGNLADFKTHLSDVHIVYELATPQTIQLTGQQISTFLGTNNVWCDSGKIIHLEY